MLRRLVAAAALVSACSLQRVPPQSASQSAVMDDHMAHMSAADMRLPTIVPSRQQGDAKLPPSANTAAARVKASPRHAEWVKIAVEPGSKDTIEAWVVYP